MKQPSTQPDNSGTPPRSVRASRERVAAANNMDEDEAMELALAEVAAVRAERRARREKTSKRNPS